MSREWGINGLLFFPVITRPLRYVWRFNIIGICCAVINITVICIYYTWGKVN
ncbi:hypothetical protein ECAA86_03755 [Escherichia coli AA86]|nr:hypothetical protein ECAA86_03755 [Escherichia coli AA86]